jgi:hypothetical protein
MTKVLAAFLVLASLAGCYNPRYPSESPGTERTEHQTVTSSGPVAGGTYPATEDEQKRR